MRPTEVLKFKSLFENERRKTLLTNEMITDTYLDLDELEASIRLHLRNREVLYLRTLEDALRRISEGTFGFCEGCDREIGVKRLEVRPTATHCLDCKEKRERVERRHVMHLAIC